MTILILLGVVFISGWMTLIHLAVRNEVRFEDEQVKEMREFRERDKE